MQGADFTDTQLHSDQLSAIDNFDDDAAALTKTATEHSRMSARVYHKIQEVARTTVDLNAEASNSQATIAEARA